MHDIRLLRDDPAAFDQSLGKRGISGASERVMAADLRLRALIEETEKKQNIQKDFARRIGALKGECKKLLGEADLDDKRLETLDSELHDNIALLLDRGAEIQAEIRAVETQHKQRVDRLDGLRKEIDALQRDTSLAKFIVPVLEQAQKDASAQVRAALAELPNRPAADVPDGADEDANVIVHTRGTPAAFAFAAKEHDVLGPPLGLDFETGAAIAGARFTLVRGPMARLARALGQFMLDRLSREHGYEEVVPPLLVREAALFGTGQLPKFADDLFRTTDDRWLIPTAEVSLTNIVRETILAERELPLRFAALTPCFRSEAGAAGRDTRGYIRQHQFDKVEMVSIVTPGASDAEHERMTRCAEGVLDALALPYRRMLLCTGDMGFSAARTYDLEVWLPGQNRYREISSCSTCTDFQARRMNARYRPEGEKGTRFVHTLNGSGLAVGRTLVAVVENYQQENGAVAVPDALRPYLGGLTVLEPAR